MNILVACEYSGVVREAFRAQGHKVISCDLLPTDQPGAHIEGDVTPWLSHFPWDMVIAFPPCTHLSVSGAKHFAAKRLDGRQQKGIDFFMQFTNLSHVPKIAIENPIGIMSTEWRKPDQIIQPYMFGDPYTKTTCLWLKGLPPLVPTNIVDKGARHITKSGKSLPQWYHELPADANRGQARGKTFEGIAQAMAQQWAGGITY